MDVVKSLDIYRKVPRDLSEATTSGALVEEHYSGNFRVNREMREKIVVYNPFSDEF